MGLHNNNSDMISAKMIILFTCNTMNIEEHSSILLFALHTSYCLWVFNTLKCVLWVHVTVMNGGNIYWGRKQIIVKEIAQLSVVGCP